MLVQSQSVYVSTALRYWNPRWDEVRNQAVYRDLSFPVGVGSNLRVDLSVRSATGHECDLGPALAHVKRLCDHRTFHVDHEAFHDRPATLEAVTMFLAREIFPIEPSGGVWVYLKAWESDRLGCQASPGDEKVDLEFRVLNLHLKCRVEIDPESGLGLPRSEAIRAVRKVFSRFSDPVSHDEKQWSAALFAALHIELPTLIDLQIDLGRQRFLAVSPSS